MRRTLKNTKRFRKTLRGKGITQSKPMVKYPPLPESPTNRPTIRVNKKGLNVDEKLRRERLLPLAERVVKTRERTLKNILLGREHQKPKLDNYGYPKSAFTLNRNIGFKPNSKL